MANINKINKNFDSKISRKIIENLNDDQIEFLNYGYETLDDSPILLLEKDESFRRYPNFLQIVNIDKYGEIFSCSYISIG